MTAKDEEEQKEVDEVVFISAEGEAKMVVVKTGISDFDNIEILEGVAVGAGVITGPFLVVSKRLEDGDAVKQDNSKKDDSDD